MNYGRRFKIYREKRGLSQKEAAELLGIKSYQLANYECNRSEPKLKTLCAMSKVYDISLDMLLATAKIFSHADFDLIDERRKESEKMMKDVETILKNYVDNINNK